VGALGIQMNKYKNEIIELSNTAQALITELHENEPNSETFEQVGIINGAEIINDYISNGELGVALEHLLYMVHESGISFPEEASNKLNLIVKELNIKNSYINNA